MNYFFLLQIFLMQPFSNYSVDPDAEVSLVLYNILGATPQENLPKSILDIFKQQQDSQSLIFQWIVLTPFDSQISIFFSSYLSALIQL